MLAVAAASGGLGAALLVGVSLATASHGGATPPRVAAVADLSRGPLCPLPVPFEGFAPNTDSATVTRRRGTAPTRLVAHTRVADVDLADVHLELLAGSRLVRSAALGAMHADGRDLPLSVGDVADDGSPIGAGRYEVFIRASVTGRDVCGTQATHQISTRAGILVVG
jgi:hypothetical protein